MTANTDWVNALMVSVGPNHSAVNDRLVNRIQELLVGEFVDGDLTAGRRTIIATELLMLALEKDSPQEQSG